MKIKVASYNIHKGVGTDQRRRPDRIMAVLAEIDADIIALQEADRRFGVRAAVLDKGLLDPLCPWRTVPVAQRPASSGWHGNSLLIRKGMQLIDCAPIHLPTLEPRGAVAASVSIGSANLHIVGMHLDLSGLRRRRQAHTIIAHVEGAEPRHPTILMGDLNEWSATAGCLHEFARHFSIAETGPSFHARRPVARLDRIMVSRDLRIVACGVHQSATAKIASDHLPIWATIEGTG